MLKDNINYYKTKKVPIKILETAKIMPEEIKKEFKLISGSRIFKIVAHLALFIAAISCSVYFASAYEAHVINVTAHICDYSETRTPGFWKTHEEITTILLPKTVGCKEVMTFEGDEGAFDILDSNAEDMRDKLASHLLAMKLNIAYYGVGGYVADTCGGNGKTIEELVSEADALLCDPNTERKELEDMKKILDCLNNLHQLKYCSNTESLFKLFVLPEVTLENTITTDEGIDIVLPTSTEIFLSQEEQSSTSTEETTATTTEESTTTTEEMITGPETPETPPEGSSEGTSEGLMTEPVAETLEGNSAPPAEPTGEGGEPANTEPSAEPPPPEPPAPETSASPSEAPVEGGV